MRITRSLAVVGALALAALVAPPAHAETEDPNLQQKVEAGQEIVHGQKVLNVGHVDMGPKYVDGQWKLMIHDDAAKADADATSVWRFPDETVMQVFDQGKLTVPDDPAYEFLGAEPGSDVWVVPQTQNPEVVWLGWNTQDPEVMAAIDRGVTLSLVGAQGPGSVVVYLQSGSFGEPQLLWDTRVTDPQPIWVDVNTHTHANWVFTEPGVYLLQLRAEADLVGGGTASDTALVRFAVGTATSAEEAFAATWQGPEPATAQPTLAPAQEEPAAEDSDWRVPALIGAIVAVGLALLIGFPVAVIRGNRARDRVLAERTRQASDPDDEDDQ